jgi:Ca2+-binding RTX toxin-like protein
MSDPQVFISVSDAGWFEGDAGTSTLRFIITRSGDVSRQLSLSVYTSAAVTGEPSDSTNGQDYEGKWGHLTMQSGQTSLAFDVSVYGDQTVESDERFFLYVYNPPADIKVLRHGTGWILNDDPGTSPIQARLDAGGVLVGPSGVYTDVTADVDLIRGTNSDDVFRVSASGLTSGDLLDARAGFDTLTIVVNADQSGFFNAGTMLNGVRLDGVEKIEVAVEGNAATELVNIGADARIFRVIGANGDNVLRAASPLGETIVLNGGFNSGGSTVGWNGNFVGSGGNSVAVQHQSGTLQQTLTMQAGVTYSLSFDARLIIANSGTVFVSIGGRQVLAQPVTGRSFETFNTEFSAMGSADLSFSFLGGEGSGYGSIDNVAVRLLRMGDGTGTTLTPLVLSGGEGDDTLIGGQGADQLSGDRGNDTLRAGGGDDILAGGAGNDKLIGGNGADQLDGGAGADVMEGEAGDDTYTVDDAGDTIIELADAGTDAVFSSVSHSLSAHAENLTLTGSGDTIGTGNNLDNVITGNAGDNTLSGLGGADTLIGGSGNDTYLDVTAEDTVSDIAGTDEIRLAGGVGSYTLPNGIERLTGSPSTAATLAGNELANTITGSDLDDVISGLGGADRLFGGKGNDILYATSLGASAGAGADELDGGEGNDVLHSSGSGNILRGGAGDDVYVMAGGNTLIENADEGVDEVRVSFLTNYTLAANIENLTATGAGARTFTGNAQGNVIKAFETGTAADTLRGEGGNDTLHGYGGADTLLGGAGDDILIGGQGSDVLSGGDGFDTASYVGAPGGVTVDMLVAGTNAGEATGDTYLSIEAIIGTDAHDNVFATFGDDRIDGRGGMDVIFGRAGNDTLNGGGGGDWLQGNAGADTFDYDNAADSTHSAPDFIADFSSAEGDRIDLDGLLQSLGFQTASINTGWGTGASVYTFDQGSWSIVQIYTGTTLHTQVIVSQANLSASDFIL